MCSGPLLRNIILYTLPIILSSVLQLLFNAADLIVVGNFASSSSVGAVGATGALINLIINLFLGLSVGAGVIVAQGLGAHDDHSVSRAVHTAIPLSLIGGAILTVVGLMGARTFLSLMGTPDNILPLSTVYMQIYFCGMIPICLYNFGASILRAAGDTRSPLIYLTIAGVLNVILNLIFVILFHMDVAGVALATTLSQILSALLTLRAIARRTDALRFDFRQMHLYGGTLRQILRIGLPAGMQGSIFSISNVIIQSSINSFDPTGILGVVSGNAAAANVESFIYVSMTAYHQTAMNFVGQNIGARNYRRIPKIIFRCLALSAATGLILGIATRLFAPHLLLIYLRKDPGAITYGVLRISFVATFYFLCGIMDVMTGIMRGMGASLAPMLITVIGVCGIRIGWIYTVFRSEAYHSLASLYISYPISWAVTFVAQTFVFFLLWRRLQKRDPDGFLPSARKS